MSGLHPIFAGILAPHMPPAPRSGCATSKDLRCTSAFGPSPAQRVAALESVLAQPDGSLIGLTTTLDASNRPDLERELARLRGLAS